MNRRYWDNLAASFSDEVIELAKEDRDKVLLEELDLLASKRRRVVDLGCGVGVLIPELEKRFQKVLGVDFSKKLLGVAEGRYGGARVSFMQADLTAPIEPAALFDVTVCSSVLILSSRKKRRRIMDSIVRFTRHGGTIVITVPALESCIHVYQTLIHLRKELGGDNGLSRREARREFDKEVPSVLDGLVSIQGVPTKHWMKQELVAFIQDAGLTVERVRQVDFSWESEIDSPPEWLGKPYPWDWLVVARRLD